jgi:hypothetical protein
MPDSREEKNRKQREYRIRVNNVITKRYEKTRRGFLMRVYCNLEARVTGVQPRSYTACGNRELLGREEFYAWSLDHPDFQHLFGEWEASEYDKSLTPCLDRIHYEHDYTVLNLQWVTVAEHRDRVNAWQHHGRII